MGWADRRVREMNGASVVARLAIVLLIAASCGGTAPDTSSSPTTTTAVSTTLRPTTTTTAAETTTSEPMAVDVEAMSEDPVVDDANYNGPGAVAATDNGYVMFVNEYLRWPPKVDVHLYTSVDGLTWTAEGDEPVIDFDSTGAPAASIVSSVVQEADGSWTLFFYSYEGSGATTAKSVGRATAPHPGGPWTVDAAPVFTVGPDWDSGTISTPTVIRTDTGYVMFYTGGKGDGVTAIGRADSTDGTNWVRTDQPVFTGTGDDTSWDSHRVSQPNLFVSNNGVLILYKGNSVGALGSDHGLACASSLDPTAVWERVSAEPILEPGDVPRGRMIFSTEAIRIGGNAALFLSVSRDATSSSTDVYGLWLPIVDRNDAEGLCDTEIDY